MIQVCGPIAAVAGFFRQTLEEADYIRMRYKNVLVNTQGELLLMVVDLKKHRSREHVDRICQMLLEGHGSKGGRLELLDRVRENIKHLY